MSICATYDASGAVSVVTPPPVDMSTCALLIPTTDDRLNDPFHLSAADGSSIAIAIILVWSVGFAGRAIIRCLNTGEKEDENA